MTIERDENGNFIIDTGDIRERKSYEPSQATPVQSTQFAKPGTVF